MTPKTNLIKTLDTSSNDTIAPRKKKTTWKNIESTTSAIMTKSLIVRSLLVYNTTHNIVDKPWLIVAFRPSDLRQFHVSPYPLIHEYFEWLPKFNGSNVIFGIVELEDGIGVLELMSTWVQWFQL